jgi:predicted phage gp36 major capsid-like protein
MFKGEVLMNKKNLYSAFVATSFILGLGSQTTYGMFGETAGQDALDADAALAQVKASNPPAGTTVPTERTTVVNNYYGKSSPLRTAIKLACTGAVVVLGWRYGKRTMINLKNLVNLPARVKDLEREMKAGFDKTNTNIANLSEKTATRDQCAAIDSKVTGVDGKLIMMKRQIGRLQQTADSIQDKVAKTATREQLDSLSQTVATKQQVDALRDGIALTFPSKQDLARHMEQVAKTSDVEKLAGKLATKDDVQLLARIIRTSAQNRSQVPEHIWSRILGSKQN